VFWVQHQRWGNRHRARLARTHVANQEGRNCDGDGGRHGDDRGDGREVQW